MSDGTRLPELTAEPIEAWRYWRVVQDGEDTRLASVMVMRATIGIVDSADQCRHGKAQLDDLVSCGGFYYSPIVWGRTAEARCVSPRVKPHGPVPLDAADHSAPLKGCTCGFYGMKDVVAQPYNEFILMGGGWAYGKVLFWGRWFEHEYGWRAQYARPADILVIGATAEQCESLHAFYGCVVREANTV